MSPKMVASSQDLYSLIPYKMQAEFILPLAKNQFFMGATSTESGSQDLWLGALQWKQK
jgi:hypothetical protein